MGCPAVCSIGENLVFSVCTHDPDTGVLTDADSLPTYRVYEAETGTPILTGSMAKLDDGNTTGFYTEQLVISAGNGFEALKTYTIYIEGTVNSNTGGMSYGFRVDTSANAILSSVQTVDEIVDAILVDTGVTIPGLIAALNNLSAAEVNAEIVDALGTDTMAELSAIPAATPTIKQALMLLYMALRNEGTESTTTRTLKKDSGVTLGTATTSDDGSLFTKGKFS